jgi:hypothetical protein
LASWQNGSVQKLQGTQSRSRTTFQKYKMQPGVYIAKVIVDFDPQWDKEFDVNLAVYGEFACLISLASKQQACAFAGKQVNWTGEDVEGQSHWNNLAAWGVDSIKGFGSIGGNNGNQGFTQPQQQGGNNGWGQPQQQGGNNGWGQPQQQGGNNGWGQPQQPQQGGNNGWGQPQQPQQGGNNGWGQPQQQGGNNGWGQPPNSGNQWGSKGGW